MARTMPAPPHSDPIRRADLPSPAWSLLFYAVALIAGLAAAGLVGQHLGGLGLAPQDTAAVLHDLLALDGAGGQDTTLGATALSAGALLLSIVMLACAAGAALTLVAGTLAAALPAARQATHRVVTIGLWMCLLVCLAAMLPVAGHPFVTLPPDAPTAADLQWPSAPKLLAVLAGAGLLLAAITSQSTGAGRSQRR